MIAIFICGRPCCGKTSIAKSIQKHYQTYASLLSSGLNVQHVEMSNVVKEWQLLIGKSTTGLLVTDKKSSMLHNLLWTRLVTSFSGVSIISGVREPFLLDEPIDFMWNGKVKFSWIVYLDMVYNQRNYLYNNHRLANTKLPFSKVDDLSIDLGVDLIKARANQILNIDVADNVNLIAAEIINAIDSKIWQIGSVN